MSLSPVKICRQNNTIHLITDMSECPRGHCDGRSAIRVRGVAPLSAILADESASSVTRAYAANALGRIREAAALDALVVAAQVKDDMIRRQVAIALGRIDRDVVVPHLLKLREDESIAVAEVAAEAMGRWEDKLGRQSGAKWKAVPKKSVRKTRSTKKKLPAQER